jgi:hypothetical protein
MKAITNILLAISTFSHQIHLNFKDYGTHLLADRLRDGIDDDIDRLKELAMPTLPSISSAKSSLSGALDFIKDIPETKSIDEMFSYLLQLEEEAVRLIAAEIGKTKSEGIKNSLADISEKREQNIYLIKNRLKNG